MRRLPYVRKTDTLIPFEMLSWEDVSSPEEKSQSAKSST